MSLSFAFSLNPFTDAGNVILRTLVSWVQHGAASAIRDVAGIISVTTTPQLTSSWFSTYYWRIAGLATLLTVPFLFAAALQAVVRSDLALLGRAVFGYLPLALIGVGIASPITMLLLSATDEMSAVVSGLAVGSGSHFLTQMAQGFVTQSDPFYAVFAELIAIGAALTLSIELLAREAAVYIVVLMLPLAFSALVWPARRIWVVRLLELLVALIVSKFVIVAVLSLAGAAYGHSGLTGMSRVLLAMSLLLLAAFAPWTMLRLLPFTELAAGAAGALQPGPPAHLQQAITDPARRAHEEFSKVDDDPVRARRRCYRARHRCCGNDHDANACRGDRRRAVPRFRARSSAGGMLASMDSVHDDVSADQDAAGPAGKPEPEARRERLPGMDPIWQAERTGRGRRCDWGQTAGEGRPNTSHRRARAHNSPMTGLNQTLRK